MSKNNKKRLSYFLILFLSLLCGAIHAEENQRIVLEKMEVTKRDLKKRETRELLFTFNNVLKDVERSSESVEQKLKLYAESALFLQSMINDNYDPNFMAPTSVPLPDTSLSSGSDPNQVADPEKRKKAIEERYALAAKIEKHNFQRDLRKEISSIISSAKVAVGVTSADTITAIQSKFEAAGLTRDEALSLLGHMPDQSSPPKK